jgi:hypothetical protein
LSPELIQQGFKQAGVATIRKRRLPLETVLWSIIGMALYRQKSVWDIATQMDIMLPDKKPVHPENRYLNGFSDIISLKIAS